MTTTTTETRILGMVKRCKNRGGDCGCGAACKALGCIALAEENCRREQERLARLRKRLETPTARLRDGWQFPPAPHCPTCGVPCNPAAYFEGEEVYLHFLCSQCHGDPIDADFGWPFDAPCVYAEDVSRLGFEVV